MAGCCNQQAKFDGLSPEYRRALWAVIAINAVMFLIEMAAGTLAGSQALKADALDFLGDTLTYGISLYVIGMSLKVRATAALFKGVSLAAMGLWVFAMTAWKVFTEGVPDAPVMGVVGFLALAANVASVLILMRYKDGDANVRSRLDRRGPDGGLVLLVGDADRPAGAGRTLHRRRSGELTRRLISAAAGPAAAAGSRQLTRR